MSNFFSIIKNNIFSSLEDFKRFLNEWRGETCLISFLNLYSYHWLRRYPSLAQGLRWGIDGISLCFLLNLLKLRCKRLSFDMTSLAPIVFEWIALNRKRIYIVGAKDSEIKSFVSNLKNKYHNLKIIGFRNGYFFKKEYYTFLKYLASLQPDVVLSGMGVILQEKFLIDLTKEGWQGIGITCGGFIHQGAQKLDYYPKWIDKLNIRWFYRMLKEHYVIKRVFIIYPYAVLELLFDFLVYKTKNNFA